MAKKTHNNKYRTLTRYGFIIVGFLLISALIVGKLFTTTIVEAEAWNARAKADLSRQTKILPERGNILSDKGNILACNIQVYDIRIDMSHPSITVLGKKAGGFKWEEINALADSLDKRYPLVKNFAELQGKEREENSWRKKLAVELNKQPEKRSKRLTIARKQSLEDFEQIKALPFLSQWQEKTGYRNPVYIESQSQRIYPYGSMARRSIGRVNEKKNGEIHGFSGVECDLDSLLYGQPGIARKVTLNSGVANWVSQPAVRGYDIQTTFDIDLQDMLEDELTRVCSEARGEWGTAILMEVESGEIKAMANVQRMEDGTYGEALNRAVRGFEPGSVMKPISLMIALEDGLVKNENSTVDCSPFQRTSDHAGGGIKTMKQVIETSSNTGIARVIFRGYQEHPEKYYDRLSQIGFFEPMKSGIDYREVPYMRRLTEIDKRGARHTMTERHLDLARQAYGYTTTIPPIYTLAIYNAIANNGKYVRPHVMRRITNEFIDSVIPRSYIRDRICSEETARAVRVCLREPVWGSRGTARAVQDDRVEIAGKTGTAYPMKSEKGGGYDTSRRRYAFAGFFPYDKPKYSCMVLILAPSGTSAARTSGQVLKNVAVKMYARGMLDNNNPFTAQRSSVVPLFTNMTLGDRGQLSTALKLAGMRTFTSTTTQKGTVPSVIGYDAASAINILEKSGLNVTISGTGHVKAQSIEGGSVLRKGGKIHLTLGV